MRLIGFGVCTFGTSLILSGLIRLWLDLPWWKIFRRCVSVSAVLVLWLFMRYVHRQPLRSLGLGSWRFGKQPLVQGAMLGFGTVFLVGGLYLGTQVCRIAVTPDQDKLWRVVLGFLPAAGLVGLVEELIFRGYVLQQLLACSTRLAISGSSLLYALVHVRPTWVWPASSLEFVGLAILGWVLASSVLRTRQLYLAIGLHAGLAYCARVNKLVVEFTQPSLQWLVGTNRLVNGMVAWLALLGVGRIMARWGNAPAGR